MRENAIKLIGIAVAVVVLAVVGVGGAVYFGIVSVPWGSARRRNTQPDTTPTMSWFTLGSL